MVDAIVRAEKLRYAYAGGPTILDDLSLTLRRGERVGIVGANGAGKSTLLMLLAGVMPPDAGLLEVDGVVSARPSLKDLREFCGLVFQNPDDMLFTESVRDDVAFGIRNRYRDGGELERRVAAALAATGSSGLAGAAPWKLSGGEKRSVSIAAVLAMEPDILLLDEPSAGLDPASRRALIRLIPTLPGTIVVASHDLDLVLDVCRRVVILDEGKVAADGDAETILSDAALLQAHRLELPLGLQGRKANSR